MNHETTRARGDGWLTGPGVPIARRNVKPVGDRGEEAASAGRMLARKYPVVHGFLIPLVHRLRGNETIHIELRPIDNGEVPA